MISQKLSLPLRLGPTGLKVPDFRSGEWCYLKGHYGGSAEDPRRLQMSGGKRFKPCQGRHFNQHLLLPQVQ